MANQNVERLKQQRSANVDFTIPPFPDLPETMTSRFPEMRVWWMAMQDWRETTEAALKTTLLAIRSETVE